MNDVVLAALFSSAGAALVAVAGAVASIFGPAWRESAQRRNARLDRVEDDRYARAIEFVEALITMSGREGNSHVLTAQAARMRFLATLRPGEGAIEEFTRNMFEGALAGRGGRTAVADVAEGGEALFSWLRGDRRTSDM